MLKISKFLHSTSLFFRVASIVLVSIILVSLSTSIIVIKISKDTLVDTFSKSNYKVLTQISDNFIDLNDKIINCMNAIDSIQDFQRYFTEAELSPQVNYSTIYNMKTKLAKMAPEKDFIDITVLSIGLNGKTFIGNNDLLIADPLEILNADITKNALANKNIISYQYIDHGFTKFTKYSSAIVTIKVLCDKYTREPYGLVYVLINQNTFQKYYDYFVGNGNNITI